MQADARKGARRPRAVCAALTPLQPRHQQGARNSAASCLPACICRWCDVCSAVHVSGCDAPQCPQARRQHLIIVSTAPPARQQVNCHCSVRLCDWQGEWGGQAAAAWAPRPDITHHTFPQASGDPNVHVPATSQPMQAARLAASWLNTVHLFLVPYTVALPLKQAQRRGSASGGLGPGSASGEAPAAPDSPHVTDSAKAAGATAHICIV